MRPNAVWALIALSGGALAGACTAPGREAPLPAVAASVFPLHDLTRRVAGTAQDVELLLPPGGDVHGSRLSPRQVARLRGVRLVVGVGPGFDAWILEAARGAGADPRALWLGGPAPLRDPHVWLDPAHMRDAVAEVGEALAGIDPSGAAGYRERASQLAGELDALDAALRRRSAGWPRRPVATAHAFLGPFAERYGVEVAAVLEAVPGRELTPGPLSEALAAMDAAEGLAAILVPVGESGPAARVASEETGLPLVEVDLVGGGEGDSYEDVLRRLADTLERALRPGSAP